MGEFERAGKHLRRLPDSVFERLGGKENELEAIWNCKVCGPIMPRRVANGFLPAKCACQLRAQEERERLALWQEQEKLKSQRLAKCFTWLCDPRPREHASMSLSTFQLESEMQQDALAVAFDFLEQPTNLILWSETYGSGKTHLAAALCNEMQQRRQWKCLFAACQDLFRAIEARWDKPDEYPDTASDLVRRAASCDLLVLDDLARLGKYRKELDEIVDARHNKARPTILTLNAEHVEVTESEIVGISCYIGKAASDRLCDKSLGGLVVCEMNGPSWRRRKR